MELQEVTCPDKLCAQCDKDKLDYCIKCKDLFFALGGKCHLKAEDDFLSVMLTIVEILGIIIALSVVYQLSVTVYHFCTEKRKAKRLSMHKEQLLDKEERKLVDMGDAGLSLEAMRIGHQYAKQSTAKDWAEIVDSATADNWAETIKKPMPENHRYPFLVDVHNKFIIGVGLPLFYNFHFLPLSAAFVSIGAMGYVSWTSGLTAAWEAASAHWNPDTEAALKEATVAHTTTIWYAIGLLYIFLLFTAWMHAYVQQYIVERFDQQNSTMVDYTARMDGLPPDVTSEAKLHEFCQKLFGCEIEGVSIGYDLYKKDSFKDDVWNMQERAIVQHDVSRCDPNDSKDGGVYGYHEELANPDDLHAPDQQKWNSLVAKGQLCNAGFAWVVFRHKASLDRALGTYCGVWFPVSLPLESQQDVDRLKASLIPKMSSGSKDLLEIWPSGEAQVVTAFTLGDLEVPVGTRINIEAAKQQALIPGGVAEAEWYVKLSSEVNEPTSMMWFNFGTPDDVQRQRLRKTVVIVSVVFIAVIALVYVPYAYFLLLPYAKYDSGPGPLTGQIMGFLVGIANNILGAAMGINLWGVGFMCRNSLDRNVLIFATLTGYYNTLFNLMIGLYPMVQEGGLHAVKVDVAHNNVDVSKMYLELELSNLLYNILVPGWLFSGFIIGNIVGFIVPTIQNELLLRLVFACRCLPYWLNKIVTLLIPYNPEPGRLYARKGEQICEYGEIALAWDYTTLIITPSIVFAMLFFINTRTWMIFVVLLAWVSFMYLYHRFIHFRYCKKSNHASSSLDGVAIYIWGLPLAIVAEAWAWWGSRLGYCSMVSMCPAGFVLSLVIYWGGLKIIGTSGDVNKEEEDQEYVVVSRRLLYSWFNLNPVHMLKSRYGDFNPVSSGPGMLPKWWSTVSSWNSKVPKANQPFLYGKEYQVLNDLTPPKRNEKSKHLKKGKTGTLYAFCHIFILVGVSAMLKYGIK